MGVIIKVFGIFNGASDPNFRKYGDDNPSMINNLLDQYPADLYDATTQLEHLLTRGECLTKA
ncbi:hypothetical protein ANCCAN_10619 [Ancylostoma caninum]|uniref:Uncharacterized protein n=1 Tax=Ancylostoma caninum TaxID=29170 RepID=A0A368GIB0_ANCCA|nr:hypothetical protein ANCCAN_10619 [Ancylostoma caninum]